MDQFQVSEKLQFKHLLFIDKDYDTFFPGDIFICSITKPVVIGGNYNSHSIGPLARLRGIANHPQRPVLSNFC